MFDYIDAAFPLTNWCSLLSPYLVGSPPIFGRIGSSKSAKTPSALVVLPAMTFRAIVGIDGGFIPWYNSSDMLKI